MVSSVTFLGVRGSFPCPDSDKIVYGGNTACVEIRFDDTLFCIDAGTGVKTLGTKIRNEDIREFYMFISHLHWDHISGLPTFLAALNENVSLHIHAGLQPDQPNLKTHLSELMRTPFFPVPVSFLRSAMTFNDFSSGENLSLLNGSIQVQTAPLNHPNGATGYAFIYKGQKVAYISDTEHFKDKDDENVLKLMENADLAIYDAAYTDEEYPKFTGWGHSTCEQAVKLAKKANVKKLALFHHAPEHTDEFLRKTEQKIQRDFPNAFYAKEGQTVIL